MAKSKKKQPKRYLFEEVLAFLKHNDGKSFNYNSLVLLWKLIMKAIALPY